MFFFQLIFKKYLNQKKLLYELINNIMSFQKSIKINDSNEKDKKKKNLDDIKKIKKFY